MGCEVGTEIVGGSSLGFFYKSTKRIKCWGLQILYDEITFCILTKNSQVFIVNGDRYVLILCHVELFCCRSYNGIMDFSLDIDHLCFCLVCCRIDHFPRRLYLNRNSLRTNLSNICYCFLVSGSDSHRSNNRHHPGSQCIIQQRILHIDLYLECLEQYCLVVYVS